MKTSIQSKSPITMGMIQGSCLLPEHTTHAVARLAEEFFAEQEEAGWSGNPVETYAVPPWMLQSCDAWKPSVQHLGFSPTGATGELVFTAGVDQHTDDAHGATLMIVLHNEGLRFKQGKVVHAPLAGEWFVFDDRLKHGVSFGKKQEVFVGWAIPLKPWEEQAAR